MPYNEKCAAKKSKMESGTRETDAGPRIQVVLQEYFCKQPSGKATVLDEQRHTERKTTEIDKKRDRYSRQQNM